jgi:hypothetical protein
MFYEMRHASVWVERGMKNEALFIEHVKPVLLKHTRT